MPRSQEEKCCFQTQYHASCKSVLILLCNVLCKNCKRELKHGKIVRRSREGFKRVEGEDFVQQRGRGFYFVQ